MWGFFLCLSFQKIRMKEREREREKEKDTETEKRREREKKEEIRIGLFFSHSNTRMLTNLSCSSKSKLNTHLSNALLECALNESKLLM